jgi:hypothetical protein
MLPKLLDNDEMFRYYSCIFRIKKSKIRTARAVFFQQYCIKFTYTVEASISSYIDANRETQQLNGEKYMKAGVVIG